MEVADYLACRARVEAYDPEAFRRARHKEPPKDALEFARIAAFVVIGAGVSHRIAKQIFGRIEPLVVDGEPLAGQFRHARKSKAIDDIVADRDRLFDAFRVAWSQGPDAVTNSAVTVPYVGPVTKFHLAMNLGVDCAKPDVWLERIAARSGEDTPALCSRLSRDTGDPVRLVDYVIRRACERRWWTD